MKAESGNALFLILIAVALFAALSYAITQSSRGGGGIAKEQAMLDQAVLENYISAINHGRMRLQIVGGCAAIDYRPPASQPTSGDMSCYLFHADGGGVTWQDMGLGTCDIAGEEVGPTMVVGSGTGSIYLNGNDIIISDAPVELTFAGHSFSSFDVAYLNGLSNVSGAVVGGNTVSLGIGTVNTYPAFLGTSFAHGSGSAGDETVTVTGFLPCET